MNYKTRLLEAKLKKVANHFPVVVLTGARQVGKTTLLKYLLNELCHPSVLVTKDGKNITAKTECSITTQQQNHFTFDPSMDIGNARQDPELFLDHVGTPVLLDEIQYVPELLSALKRRVDINPQPGQYWLTGSQNLNVLKNIAESLAGRAAVLSLHPMSLGEMFSKPFCWIVDYLNDPRKFFASSKERIFAKQPISLATLLWRGCYPGLLDVDNEILQISLDSYLRTYLERDVRVLSEVTDLHEFSRFVQLLANYTAQEINYSQLGREINITPQTAKRWLNILVSTFQWMEIPAFANNLNKRLSNKSKGYFVDSGLAAQIMHISSPDALATHPQLGALFETFIVQDIIKQLTSSTMNPGIYHWRAHSGAEIDLLLEINNCYFPIEIKCSSKLVKKFANGIEAFRAAYQDKLNIAPGIIIAPVEQIFPVTKNCYAVPYDLI